MRNLCVTLLLNHIQIKLTSFQGYPVKQVLTYSSVLYSEAKLSDGVIKLTFLLDQLLLKLSKDVVD